MFLRRISHALQLLASSLDLFHLDSSSGANGDRCPSHQLAAPLTCRAAGQSEFTYAPEDEDIFFYVSDGSDGVSVDLGCGLHDDGAVDALDIAVLGARCGGLELLATRGHILHTENRFMLMHSGVPIFFMRLPRKMSMS